MSKKLAEENLEGLLKCEANLIGEIRGLDGERKALVYDNYSKLIGATETIGKVRFNFVVGHLSRIRLSIREGRQEFSG